MALVTGGLERAQCVSLVPSNGQSSHCKWCWGWRHFWLKSNWISHLPSSCCCYSFINSLINDVTWIAEVCVLYFISHQLKTVNVPHWAFNWDKCDFFTALYHPSSVPLFWLFFFTLKFLFICLVCQTLLTFRDHYRVLHWMTDWPEETQRWGGEKCINRKTPPASTGQRSQGRTFSALLTFLPVKAKCWGAADIFFLPSVAAAFILFIFLPPTPQLPVYYFRP